MLESYFDAIHDFVCLQDHFCTKNSISCIFYKSVTYIPTDGRTDGPTDRRTDKASYRVACPQLKNESHYGTIREEEEEENEVETMGKEQETWGQEEE